MVRRYNSFSVSTMIPVREKSLVRSAYRFFIIGKLFGVSCFSIKKNANNGKYTEVTRSDMTVLFGFLALQIFLAYKNIVFPQNMSKDDQIFNNWAQLLIGSAPIVCCVSIFKTFLNREKLWTVIFDLRSIDKRLTRLGIEIDYSLYDHHISIYLFVIYVTFCGYMSMFVAFLVTTNQSSIFYVISCVFVNGMITVISNQFHLLLAVFYTRFTLLNKFMLKIFNLNNEATQQTNGTSLLATISEITRIHQSLNAIAITTNNLFAFHMFGGIASTLCMSIFPLYEIFQIISSVESSNMPLSSMSLGASAIFHNTLVIILVILSHLTKRSSDQTAVIAHKAIATMTDNSMILRIWHMSDHASYTLFYRRMIFRN